MTTTATTAMIRFVLFRFVLACACTVRACLVVLITRYYSLCGTYNVIIILVLLLLSP